MIPPETTANVLIVDDNERTNNLVNMLLTNAGYETETAFDGVQALKAVTANPPDLVVLDVMMPRMDGYEVAEKLRARLETRSIPILMLTALRELDEKVKGLDAGADDFLVKPFNTVELLARVRSLIRIKQLHDELEAKNALLERVLMRYISKDVALEILRNPEQNLKLGGQNCTVSVLFADIRGFTHFSELHDAAEVIDVLNCVFNQLTPLIFQHKGTLDKYMGDAIMALYGAPLTMIDGMKRAVHTGWMMQQRFAEMRKQNALIDELGLGIGISTGKAVVGNVGSDQFMDYTVIGNTPNIAKRLQEHAKRGQILIDIGTYRHVQTEVDANEIIPLYGRGFSKPIRAYEVLNMQEMPQMVAQEIKES
jgi:class 3 adenylate cyclase